MRFEEFEVLGVRFGVFTVSRLRIYRVALVGHVPEHVEAQAI